MKIILGIPLLAVLVILNSICEGSCRTEDPLARPTTPQPTTPQPTTPRIVAIKVLPTDFIMVPLMSGHWYGGGFHQQVKGFPEFIRNPQRLQNMCEAYVQMPDGSGLVGSLSPLKVATVPGIITVHAAVKVETGFALIALKSINPRNVPYRIVHTRLYLVTPEGRLLYGVITKKDIRHLKGKKK